MDQDPFSCGQKESSTVGGRPVLLEAWIHPDEASDFFFSVILLPSDCKVDSKEYFPADMTQRLRQLCCVPRLSYQRRQTRGKKDNVRNGANRADTVLAQAQ